MYISTSHYIHYIPLHHNLITTKYTPNLNPINTYIMMIHYRTLTILQLSIPIWANNMNIEIQL